MKVKRMKIRSKKNPRKKEIDFTFALCPYVHASNLNSLFALMSHHFFQKGSRENIRHPKKKKKIIFTSIWPNRSHITQLI